MTVRADNRRACRICAATAAAVLAFAPAASAQQPGEARLDWKPTLNTMGVTGLIDMPTGEAQPDGQFSTTVSYFGGISRSTLTFQLHPRLSGSFRYTGTADLNIGGYVDYYDRSFDVQFLAIRQGKYLPSVTVGFQDFAGTGLYSGEYVAATRRFGPDLAVTAGLGWGRLGSYNSIGSPFGARPAIAIGQGGKPNFETYFRGPAAPFAGVEWQATDRLGVKVEYSSDAYDLEVTQGVLKRSSPFNFGVEYQLNPDLRIGGYYLYGTEVGISAQLSFNPKTRPGGGEVGPGGFPVKPRPSRATSPEAWTTAWVDQPGVTDALRTQTAQLLAQQNLTLEAIAVSANRVELRVRNGVYDAEAQAIGRAARVLSYTMPASVEYFDIVPVQNGMALSKVTLRRTDVEALETAPNGAARLLSVAGLSDAAARPAGLSPDDTLYPRFDWAIRPAFEKLYFDPDNPYRFDVNVKGSVSYRIRPGLVFDASATKKLFGNLDDYNRPNTSVLPHVRTDGPLYSKLGDPSIDKMQVAWYTRPGRNLYGRVSVGYLERMFGGVSGEVLWKPVDSPLALGAELNYVMQRDYDGGLGFRNYDVLTGHVSAYYDIGMGYNLQLDAGRYLAGDWGGTITLMREFDNGWKVGAFATFTDVSAADFGEGSFDKGIKLTIPLAWISGRPTRQEVSTTLRPITRDGGARLEVDGRLYQQVRDYHRGDLEGQWGKVWR